MTKERTYRDALLDISTFFNGSPARWPKDGEAIDRLIAIADKALDAGEIQTADEINRLQRREREARAIMEPLTECDPAVRAWLKEEA